MPIKVNIACVFLSIHFKHLYRSADIDTQYYLQKMFSYKFYKTYKTQFINNTFEMRYPPIHVGVWFTSILWVECCVKIFFETFHFEFFLYIILNFIYLFYFFPSVKIYLFFFIC